MLPSDFVFSQANLQDYIECKRRFQLKYVEHQPWPAVEVEPALEREAFSVQGERFHRLLERYYSGIPVELLQKSIQHDDLLLGWWQAFMDEPPLNLPGAVQIAEARMSALVEGRRLVAVFDLLAIDPGQRLVIVDWKTGRHRPARETMAGRMQTLVYPFIAVEAAQHFFGGEVDPARVSMVYWFANEPKNPHVFHYDESQHTAVKNQLGGLLKEVELAVGEDSGKWPLVEDDRLCRYCVYRSLCGRGIVAGVVDETLVDEYDFLSSFDLLDVEEIGY